MITVRFNLLGYCETNSFQVVAVNRESFCFVVLCVAVSLKCQISLIYRRFIFQTTACVVYAAL